MRRYDHLQTGDALSGKLGLRAALAVTVASSQGAVLEVVRLSGEVVPVWQFPPGTFYKRLEVEQCSSYSLRSLGRGVVSAHVKVRDLSLGEEHDYAPPPVPEPPKTQLAAIRRMAMTHGRAMREAFLQRHEQVPSYELQEDEDDLFEEELAARIQEPADVEGGEGDDKGESELSPVQGEEPSPEPKKD